MLSCKGKNVTEVRVTTLMSRVVCSMKSAAAWPCPCLVRVNHVDGQGYLRITVTAGTVIWQRVRNATQPGHENREADE